MVGGWDHRPAQFRGAVLGAHLVAPGAHGSAKTREGQREARDLGLACRAFFRVFTFFHCAVADEVHKNSLFRKMFRKMFAHFVASSLARTERSARQRCAFTVPSFIPVTSAISRRSVPSPT